MCGDYGESGRGGGQRRRSRSGGSGKGREELHTSVVGNDDTKKGYQ